MRLATDPVDEACSRAQRLLDERAPRHEILTCLVTAAENVAGSGAVVSILVLDQDENTNIDQSLKSAMAGESIRAPIFEALLTKYSLGNADRFTWVP